MAGRVKPRLDLTARTRSLMRVSVASMCSVRTLGVANMCRNSDACEPTEDNLVAGFKAIDLDSSTNNPLNRRISVLVLMLF